MRPRDSFHHAMPALALALALALTLLAMSGCDANRRAAAPAAPAATPVIATSAGDPSVPEAASVLATPAGSASAATPTGRTNKAMTRAEESAAMPMPGQNNDHSAAIAAPNVPSAPRRTEEPR